MSSGPSSTSSNEQLEATWDRPTELIALLDSDNAETVEQTKALVYENLYKSRDPSLLNALVDFYLDTRSSTALQILTNTHEARINHLFDKLNDCLKHHGLRRRVETFSFLGHMVRKQPSWLYKIVKTPLFETVIKCMKTESDVLLLINGILTITTLLPLIATYVESWLHDFFEIYTRLSAFLNSRPGNIPDVYLLHLHVAIYYYFHRIYAMYPNNFVTFLRGIHHNSRSKQILFQTTIKPMLEHVRLHPCLVTENSQTEIGKHRWRKKEPQDIVIECQNISLDPVDRIQTDSGITTSWTSWHEPLTIDKSMSSVLTTSGDQFKDGYDIPRIKERRMSDSATQTGKSLQTGDHGNKSQNLEGNISGWSPTVVCGLSTPPSEHMSPATSNQDLTVPQANISMSQHCSTPVLMNTPGESPTTSLAGDVAQNNSANKQPHKRFSGGKSTPSTKQLSGQDSLLVMKPLYIDCMQSKTDTKSVNTVQLIDHQTSTPKSEGTERQGLVLNDRLHEKIITPYLEKQKSVISLSSEPVTPIDKLYSYEYGEKNKSETAMNEDGEQLTCGDHTTTTSDNVAKEIKRILSENNFASLKNKMPDNPPPSLEVSLISDGQFKPENLEQNVLDVNLLEGKGDCNHLEGSGECSSDGINIVAKTNDKGTELLPKTSGLQETTSKLTPVTTYSLQQENQQHKDTLNMYLSQNGMQEDQEEMSGNAYKKYVSSQPTPVEILDNYIQVGSSVHMNELCRLSLVSSSATDWSHFGGDAPVDEIEILRGQMQLLHHQLLYERHKCDQHATRNRRLIGKTFKAVQYQEELLATKDHLKLQEEKMRELTQALIDQTEDNRKFKEITSAWDNQQQTQLRNLLNENAQLQHDKKTLKGALEAQKKDYNALNMQLSYAQSKIFSLEQELEHIKPKLDEKDQLRYELDRLTKELVVMGEANQHHKDLIEKVSHQKGKTNPEANLQLYSCQKELSVSKQNSRKHKAEIEALHSKITDLEMSLSKKEMEVKELKKFSESLNGIYQAKLKATEEKCDAQKKINQSIEAHILNLQLALADLRHQNNQKVRTVTRSTSPIPQVSHLTIEKPPESFSASA